MSVSLDQIAGMLADYHRDVIVKCKHCGQWAASKTACAYCGAPVDPPEPPRIEPYFNYSTRPLAMYGSTTTPIDYSQPGGLIHLAPDEHIKLVAPARIKRMKWGDGLP